MSGLSIRIRSYPGDPALESMLRACRVGIPVAQVYSRIADCLTRGTTPGEFIRLFVSAMDPAHVCESDAERLIEYLLALWNLKAVEMSRAHSAVH